MKHPIPPLIAVLAITPFPQLYGDEPQAEAPTKEVPALSIQDSVVHQVEGRSLTIVRGEPTILPDPPPLSAPAPPTVEQTAWMAARRAEAAQTRSVTISATVYDHNKTFLRWSDPKSGTSFEAWSNVDFNHLQGIQGYQNNKAWYLQFLGIGNVDTVRLAERFQRPISLPAHPPLPADRPGFVLVTGDATDSVGIAPVQWLHEYYATEKTRLAAEYLQRVQDRASAPAAAPGPAAPQDNVMWFRPRKGSRYLATPEGGAR